MFYKQDFKMPIYVAKRSVNENKIEIYDTPVRYDVNIVTLPTSPGADLIQIGTSDKEIARFVADNDYVKDIKKLDRVYVYVDPPTDVDILAEEADFFVKRIIRTPMNTRVFLESTTVENEL